MIAMTGGEEKILSKVANCFYLNQLLLRIDVRKNLNSKRELQQDQEKTTKTNKNQIKPKQKRKAQQNSNQNNQWNKTKQKKRWSKNRINVIKQELTFPGCRGTRKESQ